MKKLLYKRYLLILLAPAGLLLTALAAAFPAACERFYARGLYPAAASAMGRLFSLAPFSVAQLLLVLLPAALLCYIIKCVINKGNKPHRLLRIIGTVLALASCLYFAFVLLCGLNYRREPFANSAGFNTDGGTAQELFLVSSTLAVRANELSRAVARDENGVMLSGVTDFYDIAETARDAYNAAAEDFVFLSGYTPRAKAVAAPRLMSMLEITGIYSPFTFEANVNTHVPDYTIPASTAHELAHFKGFMREDEANFVAYLACRYSENADFEYSGAMLGLTYALNALYSADRALYHEAAALLSDEVRTDFAANSAYWQQFHGPVAELAAAVNDGYLKSNAQTDGVRSYGRMVDLLVADYRSRNG